MAQLKSFGGVGRALQNKNYRRYWMGLATSTVGFWMFRVALGWYTWELTSSPAWLGIMAFSSLIPILIFGPIAGALADRVGHKKVAMYSMAGGFANALLMFSLIYFGHMDIIALFITATLQGSIVSFDFPARQSIVAELVDRPNLPAAIALNMSTFHVGSFFGPIIGGYVVAEAGIATAFLFYACTICCFFFALLFVRTAPVVKQIDKEPSQRTSLFKDVVTGLQYLLHHPSLKWIALLNISGALLLRPYMELLPGFADIIFNRSVDGFSLLVAASGLGAFTGSFLLAMRGKTQGLTNIMLIGLALAAVVLTLFATTSNFYFGQVCLFIGAMALVGAAVCSHSLIQHSVDPNLRGRVISLVMSMGVGSMAVGSLTLGALGEIIGLRWPIILGAITVVCVLILLTKKVKSHAAQLESAIT